MLHQWTIIAGITLLLLLLFFSLFLRRFISYHSGIEGILRRRHKGCTVRQYPLKNAIFSYYVCKKLIETSGIKEVWLYAYNNKEEIHKLPMPANEVPELWIWKQVKQFESDSVSL